MNALERLADFAGVDDAWRLAAACRGMNPELFFPDQGIGLVDSAIAKRVCAACPVRADCLEAGLGEQHGIWGGLAQKDRRKLRRARRAAA